MEKQKRIKSYYQVVTPESAEQGDFAEDGDHDDIEVKADEYDIENGDTDEYLAADHILSMGPVEPSSSKFIPGIWYTTVDPELDYVTGSETYYTFHLLGFSPEEEKKIHEMISGDLM